MATVIKGLAWPLRFGTLGHLERASGKDKIRSNIIRIVETAAGEQLMNPDFGTISYERVFKSMTSRTLVAIRDIVKEAISTQEPRVLVRLVRAEKHASINGAMLVTVRYAFRTSGEFEELPITVEL